MPNFTDGPENPEPRRAVPTVGASRRSGPVPPLPSIVYLRPTARWQNRDKTDLGTLLPRAASTAMSTSAFQSACARLPAAGLAVGEDAGVEAVGDFRGELGDARALEDLSVTRLEQL